MWGISAALRVGAAIRARRLNVPISPIGTFRKLTSMDVGLGATVRSHQYAGSQSKVDPSLTTNSENADAQAAARSRCRAV